MTGHLSQEALADHLADPAGPDPGVSAHLDSCPDCRRRLETLTRDSAAVTVLLSGEPAPVMPDEVFARIGDALAAEQSARRDTAERAAVAEPATDAATARDGSDELAVARTRRRRAAPAHPADTRQRRWAARFARPAGLVAAAAAVVVAGGLGISALNNRTPGTSNTNAGRVISPSPTTAAGSGNSAGGMRSSPTALHKATFARDVQALLAASKATPPPKSANSPKATFGNNAPAHNGIAPGATGQCTRLALADSPLARDAVSSPRPVTVDGKRPQLVIATGKAGHRTAVAIRGCGGQHPRIVAKASL